MCVIVVLYLGKSAIERAMMSTRMMNPRLTRHGVPTTRRVCTIRMIREATVVTALRAMVAQIASKWTRASLHAHVTTEPIVVVVSRPSTSALALLDSQGITVTH